MDYGESYDGWTQWDGILTRRHAVRQEPQILNPTTPVSKQAPLVFDKCVYMSWWYRDPFAMNAG
jgi:hypothetical protein